MVEEKQIDGLILSTENGFSPLGGFLEYFSDTLGVNPQTIANLANWNRHESKELTLIGFPNKTKRNLLKGIVLCPAETSEVYKDYATPFYGKPYRDFYYSVTFEAIRYMNLVLEAKQIAITHLSASGNFHPHIAICQVESLLNYLALYSDKNISTFSFVGCCMDREHFDEMIEWEPESNRKIRNLSSSFVSHNEYDLMEIKIPTHLGHDKEIGHRSANIYG